MNVAVGFLEDAETVAHELEGRLTKEQVVALAAKEKMLFGDGGDVARQLPRLRDDLEQETYCRLLPGYVRHFVENAAPLVDIHIDGNVDVRQADPELPDLASEEVLDCRLVGVKQFEGAEVVLCPVEHLLLLNGGQGLPPTAQRLALIVEQLKGQAEAFIVERVARSMAMERRQILMGTLSEREQFVERGFDFQEAELATARLRLSEKARGGNAAAAKALKDIKEQQRSLTQRRTMALATIGREPQLIAPGHLTFLAHALIVPSTNPEDLKRHDPAVSRRRRLRSPFERMGQGRESSRRLLDLRRV